MNENTQNKENAMLVVDQHRVESPEDKEALGEDALLGECPRCGEFINNLWNEKYCGDCGQKLKWEQERKIPLGLKAGNFCNNFCSCNRGVRPFCILKSEIFVSKGE